MAKIGTAHVEIKPVLDEAALAAMVQRVEHAVADAVTRGFNAARREPCEDCHGLGATRPGTTCPGCGAD